jgi:acyl-CoA dehydrogenase
MFTLGGELKRREKLSGRLADVLSQLYILSAVLKRYADAEHKEEDFALVKWVVEEGLFNIQTQLSELLRNFPNKIIGYLLHFIVFPLGKGFHMPSDALGKKVASVLLHPSKNLDSLLEGIYLPDDLQHERGILRQAFLQVGQVEPIEKKIDNLHKKGLIKGFDLTEKIKAAVSGGYITQKEAQSLITFNELRKHVISVDDFEKL